MHNMTFKRALALYFTLLMPGQLLYAQADQWQPVTGAETLREFISDLTVERELPNGEISRGEYRADGTGTLYSWGAAIAENLGDRGDDQVCISERARDTVLHLRKSTTKPGLYRAREFNNGYIYRVQRYIQRAVATSPPEAWVQRAVLLRLLRTK